MKCSVVIINLNSIRTFERVLKAVVGWAEEVLVVDSGSTDGSFELAKAMSCHTLHRNFDGFGTQKRFAVEQAKNDWILTLDADEIVSEELKKEIDALSENTNIRGFDIANQLVLLGKPLQFGRESKMMRIRLFNRTYGNYNLKKVHEEVEIKGKRGSLKGKVLHDSYVDVADIFQKANKYSSLASVEMYEKGKKTSLFKIITKFPLAFLTEYFIRLNFLNGYRGFLWAFSQAIYSTSKYMKLKELLDM